MSEPASPTHVVYKLDGSPIEVELAEGATVADLIGKIYTAHCHVGRILVDGKLADVDAVVVQNPDVHLSTVAESLPESASSYLVGSPTAQLHLAAAHGLSALIVVAIQQGAQINTPLEIDIEALPDADEEIRGWVPKTPLQYAAICHQSGAVKTLLSMKADPTTPCPGATNGCHKGHHAIHFCCAGRRSTSEAEKIDTLSALLNGGSTANQKSGYLGGEYTPLHDAASCGSLGMLHVLLEAKADVSKLRYNSGSGQESALYLALNSFVRPPWETESMACVSLLLEHGASTSTGFGKYRRGREAAESFAAGNDPGSSSPWDKPRKFTKDYPPPSEAEARIKSELLKAAEQMAEVE